MSWKSLLIAAEISEDWSRLVMLTSMPASSNICAANWAAASVSGSGVDVIWNFNGCPVSASYWSTSSRARC
jgi:hypothetical protein